MELRNKYGAQAKIRISGRKYGAQAKSMEPRQKKELRQKVWSSDEDDLWCIAFNVFKIGQNC